MTFPYYSLEVSAFLLGYENDDISHHLGNLLTTITYRVPVLRPSLYYLQHPYEVSDCYHPRFCKGSNTASEVLSSVCQVAGGGTRLGSERSVCLSAPPIFS